MADGARSERWDHTAVLRADLCNQWRENPISPAAFHPFVKRKQAEKPIRGNIEILKHLFVDRRDWARK